MRPVQSCKRQLHGWPTTCIRFRPNVFGRSFGRKIGVLYDDYVKNRFVSGYAINKNEEEVVLHTQEVRLIWRATKSVENARFVCLSIAANLSAKAFWQCSRQHDDAGSDWLR